MLYLQERGEAIILRAEERLRHALIPQYQQLFRNVSRQEDGVKFLVDMRADILVNEYFFCMAIIKNTFVSPLLT